MSKELETAIEAARAAGKILTKSFRAGVAAEQKAAKDLVTKADLDSEKEIASILAKAFPEHSILAEEKASKQKESDFTWIIDPLDGTNNYFYGLPMHAVSIALAKKGEIQLGTILLPQFNELYHAEKGKGAFLNGNRIQVSKRPIEKANLGTCSHVWLNQNRVNAIKKLAPLFFGTRMLGSACYLLANIAKGNMDASIEFNDKPWDYAAGWLLIEEAGGKFTDFKGNKATLDKGSYIASNGQFHEKLVSAMEGTP